MSVSSEDAVVYRSSNGRRYFTKKAAIISDVMHRLKLKNEDDGEDWYTSGQYESFNKVANRFYRRFKKVIR